MGTVVLLWCVALFYFSAFNCLRSVHFEPEHWNSPWLSVPFRGSIYLKVFSLDAIAGAVSSESGNSNTFEDRIKSTFTSQGHDGFPSAIIGWKTVLGALVGKFVSLTSHHSQLLLWVARVGQIFWQDNCSHFGTAWGHLVVNQKTKSLKTHARMVKWGG